MAEAKLPPHSIEAEQSVIGGLLLSERAWDEVSGHVSDADFYREDHRLLFQGIADLADTGQPRDLVTLTEWLRSRDLLERAGGAMYLGNLVADIPGAANIRAYANIVREHSIKRLLIHAGDQITSMGFDGEGRTAEQVLEAAETEIFAIAERGRRGGQGPVPLKSALTQALTRIESLFENQGRFAGTPTGLARLDEMTNGLQPSD